MSKRVDEVEIKANRVHATLIRSIVRQHKGTFIFLRSLNPCYLVNMMPKTKKKSWTPSFTMQHISSNNRHSTFGKAQRRKAWWRVSFGRKKGGRIIPCEDKQHHKTSRCLPPKRDWRRKNHRRRRRWWRRKWRRRILWLFWRIHGRWFLYLISL